MTSIFLVNVKLRRGKFYLILAIFPDNFPWPFPLKFVKPFVILFVFLKLNIVYTTMKHVSRKKCMKIPHLPVQVTQLFLLRLLHWVTYKILVDKMISNLLCDQNKESEMKDTQHPKNDMSL